MIPVIPALLKSLLRQVPAQITDSWTTEPASISLPGQMRTPGSTTERAPIVQSSPITLESSRSTSGLSVAELQTTVWRRRLRSPT